MNVTALHNSNGLLHRIAAGDDKSFRDLFDHYEGRFFSVSLKMTRLQTAAEELVQESFLKIWNSRNALANVQNADAYLFTAVYHEIYRYFKKLALEKKIKDVLSESPFFQNVTDETVLAQESERLFNEAVAKLPTQQQRVFVLSKEEGLSQEQIANQMHISPNTVRNHLADAVKTIRAKFGAGLVLMCF